MESWPRGLKEKRDSESDRPKPPVLHDKPQGRQQWDSVDGNPSTFHCLRLWLVRSRLLCILYILCCMCNTYITRFSNKATFYTGCLLLKVGVFVGQHYVLLTTVYYLWTDWGSYTRTEPIPIMRNDNSTIHSIYKSDIKLTAGVSKPFANIGNIKQHKPAYMLDRYRFFVFCLFW